MRSASLLFLIAANLIPLVGVLFFGWDASLILALFWIENLIIGAFNLTKMVSVMFVSKQFKELLSCGFFVLHFGLFCSVHGMLLWDLLDLGELNTAKYFGDIEAGFISIFAEGASVLFSFIERHGSTIMFAIGALCLSHLIAFIEFFLLRGDIFKTKVASLMAKPYPHIVVMHGGLLAGAFAIEKFGSTLALLIIMVVFKLAVDIANYRRDLKVDLINNARGEKANLT